MCLQVRRRNESCSCAERRGWKERRDRKMAILFSSRRGYRPSGTESFKSASKRCKGEILASSGMQKDAINRNTPVNRLTMNPRVRVRKINEKSTER